MIQPKQEKFIFKMPRSTPEFNPGRSPSWILITYFNITYYLALSPFRLTMHQGTVYVHAWLPQKILVALLTILSQLGFILDIRTHAPSKTTLSPVSVFEFALSIVSYVYKLATLRIYWTRSRSIAATCNFILTINTQIQDLTMSIPFLFRRKVSLSLKTVSSFILPITVLLVLACRAVQLFVGETVDTSEKNSIFYNFWLDRVATGRLEIFLSPTDSSISELYDWEHFLGVLATLGAFPR